MTSPPGGRRSIERFYDRHAASYEEKFSSPRVAAVKRKEEEEILAFLDRWLPPSAELLELGAGTGLFTLPLAERGHRVTATDISAEMLARLEAKLAGSSDARSRGAIRVEHVDVEDGPELGDFDAIAALGFLEYVRDPGAVLAWASATLRPGGIGVWTAPTRTAVGWCYWLVSTVRLRRPIRVYSRGSLRRLVAAAGLELVALEDLPPAPPLRSPLTRMLATRRPGGPIGDDDAAPGAR